MAICSRCRTPIPAGGTDPWVCPNCRPPRQQYRQTFSDVQPAADALIAHKNVDATDEALSITRSVGVTNAWFGPDGAGMLTGEAPRGEEGTLRVGALLVERLNGLGGDWEEPGPAPEQSDVDVIANGPGGRLEIQVTRVGSEGLWGDLSRTGAAQLLPIARDFRSAIARKAARYPVARVGEIVLALNALDAAGYALRAVRGSLPPAEVATYGFAAVWIVGPTAALIHRLDA